MTSAVSEIDRLDPQGETIKLSSGIQVTVLPLRMRQLFRLLRIVTRGGAAYLPMLRDALMMSGDENAAEVFGTQLIAIAMIALPEAEDEAVDFVQSVVEPASLLPGKDKQATEINASRRNALADELGNPDLDDLVTIIETVIDREKDDLVALGKRLGAMFNLAVKTGQVDQETAQTIQESVVQIPESPVPSPEPSISSPLSTDGPTMSSLTSPSDD